MLTTLWDIIHPRTFHCLLPRCFATLRLRALCIGRHRFAGQLPHSFRLVAEAHAVFVQGPAARIAPLPILPVGAPH